MLLVTACSRQIEVGADNNMVQSLCNIVQRRRHADASILRGLNMLMLANNDFRKECSSCKDTVIKAAVTCKCRSV